MSNQIRLKRGSGSDPSASDLVVGEVALRTDNGKLFTKKDDNSIAEIGTGLSDGDKGDITISNSGATFTIDNGAVTSAKILDGTIVGSDLATDFITTGDFTFEGATRVIRFDKSDDALEFSDEMKATFGNSGDLSISHSGTASLIQETGVGSLHITTNGPQITIDKGATESMANFITDGAVELYFDNSKKFETTSVGVTVTGTLVTTSGINAGNNISMNDNTKLKAGTGDDLQIYHDGSNSYIDDAGTGNTFIRGDDTLFIRGASNQDKAKFTTGGSVELYFDNSPNWKDSRSYCTCK